MSSISSIYDVIVIGCGASGVTALSHLGRSGAKVLGLEAAADIGGRIKTVPFGDGFVDLGAEWIHGEADSKPFDLAEINKVPLIKQNIGFQFFCSDGSRPDEDLCTELMSFCFMELEESAPTTELVGNYIKKKFYEYIANRPDLVKNTDFCTEFLNLMNLVTNNLDAANDWNDLSLRGSHSYLHLGGHQHWAWGRKGYKTVLELILNSYSKEVGRPLEILKNKEVTNISWKQAGLGKVTATCSDGTQYSAESLIVTCSLGVLKERHKKLFNPSLPLNKIRAIECISMGVMDKIMLDYKTKWWTDETTFYGFLWKGQNKKELRPDEYWLTQIFGFSTPMGSKNALTLWTSGETAKLVETLPEDDVKKGCKKLLQMFIGPKVTIPDCSSMIRSTWYSDPLIRGSYSFRGVACDDVPTAVEDLAEPLYDESGTPVVLFAGEATNYEGHHSTVHGAMDTGIREANRIMTLRKPLVKSSL